MTKHCEPIPYWRFDPDYYPKGHPERESHLARIKKFLHIDRLISMSSADDSYSITLK